MSRSRLSRVLAEPGALPSEGAVALFGFPLDTGALELPRERLIVVQGFRPDHDAWAAAGFRVQPEAEGEFAAAAVSVPRTRAGARARIAQAAAHVPFGAPIWVDGQKTDGIDAVLRELKARVALSDPLARAHGKAAWFASPGPEAFADWAGGWTAPAPGFAAPPGAFSADAPDPGSVLLAGALPPGLKGRVADLGAGWGWLSAAILTRPGVTGVDVVEADHEALRAARTNLTDPRAAFHWADARVFRPKAPLDAVVMNPPFHEGRSADPGLGAAFIRAAAGMLSTGGALWMVANRHLPYEAALRAAFREVADVAGDGRFKVMRAAHPVRGPSAARPDRKPR
ncbi:MAG: class I SAM-dependent methyltransferase [Paracoccaceae bacterium]